MIHKKITVVVAVVAILVLGACSSLKLPGSTSTDAQAQQVDPAQGMREQPVEQKLAVGTLKLEGTDLAVTAEEAKALLPLWKAVKSLSASDTATQDEIQALYTQIQETMTGEQVQAIKDMTLSGEDMQVLMKDLGIEMPQAPQGGNLGNLTEDERATRVAQRMAEGGGNFQGPPDGGGMPGGEIPGGQSPGGFSGSNQPNAQTTPMPGQVRRFGGGFNNLFVDPLIKLLEERAGS